MGIPVVKAAIYAAFNGRAAFRTDLPPAHLSFDLDARSTVKTDHSHSRTPFLLLYNTNHR
jgi:hypothetical protein